MLDVLKNYYFLLRIDKPIGVYLLLWPSLSAIWLASLGRPDILIIIVFCLGCFLTRSAGVVINDLLDQKLDRKVLRTFNRPIANKSVSNKEAILISDKLISSKLIACANIIKNVTSIFSWKKKLTKNKEVILLAKTAQKNVKRIEKTVKKLHSYDIPCILFLEIKHGNKEFLKWITRNT